MTPFHAFSKSLHRVAFPRHTVWYYAVAIVITVTSGVFYAHMPSPR